MTREERLELLKQIEKDIYVCSLESTFLDDAKSCAIHSAIEELEQEPILDKNGTSLPKGHGRLIDADRLKSMYSINRANFNTVVGIQKWVDDAPTVKAIPMSVIKELGEDLRIAQKGIADKKVLLGFNMAVALCNKHIGKEQKDE